jgi:hypothetical protein
LSGRVHSQVFSRRASAGLADEDHGIRRQRRGVLGPSRADIAALLLDQITDPPFPPGRPGDQQLKPPKGP